MSSLVISDRNAPRPSAAGALATAARRVVSEWQRRHRSRRELAAYSYDQRNDLGFAAALDAEIAKPFWRA
jgi:uncharacterized protein YjiS (DUF1127 family)